MTIGLGRFSLLRRLSRLLLSRQGLYCFTDLGGADSLTLDKHLGAVKFVLAYDVLSTLPNWDNLRLLDSEVLGEHLLDRLHMRLRHYRSCLRHRNLRTLKRSR
jgi:hypothetical protein